MENAKQEFLNVTGNDSVIASYISYGSGYYTDKVSVHVLKSGHTEEDYQAFLGSLDFNYDNGYGGQNLFGTIWCKNGVWFDRGEYDGSEWWNRNEYPAIPDELK